MDKQKTQKLKQKQASTLTAVMAEFDIETQVNRMVIRSFDSLMRSNKQAFDFIKEGEHKFILFEERLAKAQTYYLNIESNINSKVQLTQNMNSRLQEFSTEFWQGMKQHNSQVIALTKRLDQLSVEKKNLENRLGECEKNVKKLQTGQLNLNEKVNHEIGKIHETIRETDTRVGLKFQEQKHELQQLSHAITHSRSLLQSKSSLLTSLLEDLELYKHERPSIQNQLEKIFEELEHRAFKLQLSEVRGYVDSKVMEEAERANAMFMRVETMLKVEERERKREDAKVFQQIKENRAEWERKLRQIETDLARRLELLAGQLESTKESTSSSLQQISVEASSLRAKFQKQVPDLALKMSGLKISLESLAKDSRATSNEVKEAFSNIESINELLETIIKENKQRKEEMNSLKSSSANQGNVEQQVQLLLEKFTLLGQQVAILEKDTIQEIHDDLEKNRQLTESNHDTLIVSINALKDHFEASTTQQFTELTKLSKSLHSLISQTTATLNSQILECEATSRNLIQNKIATIQKQLNDLDQIQQQIRQFKEVFRSQIEENDKVNVSVAEKMERVMAMFTKMKSDISVKFQQVGGELQRKTADIKTSLNDLDAIKKHLSLTSECINVLLAAGVFATGVGLTNKDSSLLSSQSLNSAMNPDNKVDHPQSKAIKVTSILEGWVLEADEFQEKVRYRGEGFSMSQRVKLTQLFLQFYVNQSEKIKGTILENGKDVFLRVMESGEETFQQRKKATSKRKPSELPKLYM